MSRIACAIVLMLACPALAQTSQPDPVPEFFGIRGTEVVHPTPPPASQPEAVPTTQPTTQPDFADVRALVKAIADDLFAENIGPATIGENTTKAVRGKTIALRGKVQHAQDTYLYLRGSTSVEHKGRTIRVPIVVQVLIKSVAERDALLTGKLRPGTPVSGVFKIQGAYPSPSERRPWRLPNDSAYVLEISGHFIKP